MEDAAKKIYTNLGGEKMARQTALRWPFDDTRRENRWPDVAGQGLDKAAERARFVEMLGRIGYTEDEIKNFMKKMGG